MKRSVEHPGHPAGGRQARIILIAALILTIVPAALATHPWWNAGWHYRVAVTIGANGYSRVDKPGEAVVNFTQLLTSLGKSGSLDENSIRVIETDLGGTVLNASVPFQFDKDQDFNAATKASGILVVLLDGSTTASGLRYFDVYFDVTGGSFSPPAFTQRVGINENDSDGGQAAFRVDGPGTSIYFQKEAGAISSWIDAGSNDWIDWNFTPGAGGSFRGIPNAVYPEAQFHPGSLDVTSTVLSKGPLKITIRAATNNGKWAALWEFYPRYATMTMTKADHGYWFLYEGVPGGSIETGTDFVTRSDGTANFLYDQWATDISGDEWAYFSDPNVNRSLFVAHHENDAILDSYFTLSDSMTVFGFGRSNDPLEGRLLTVPQHFTIGLINGTGYAGSKDSITAAYKPLAVTMGQAEEPGPAVPVLASPADNALNVAQPVPFVWRTADRASTYRLQVSLSSAFAGVVLDTASLTDTTFTAAGLAGKTTYYWHVNSSNTSGTSAYSTSRQFQTGLSTPILLSPANGAGGQTIPAVLRWARVNGATAYTLQVSTSASFAGGFVVDEAGITDTLKSVGGLSPTTPYYWRVKATDASSAGAFSAGRSFTTAVAAPSLAAPANHAVDVPLNTSLGWHAAASALTYHVQVSPDAGFAGGLLVDDATVTDTTRAVTGLLKSSKYYWRVSAIGSGGEGSFSAVWDFTTIFPPPVLLSPANGSTGQPVNVTFRWNTGDGAVNYWFQLATDSNFVTLIKNDTTLTDTTRSVVGLLNSTTYYWRVSTKTGSAASPFSAWWKFKVLALLPGAVVLKSPSDGGSVVSDSVRLVWGRTAIASSRYWVEIGLDPAFSLHMLDSAVTDTSKVFHGLTLGHTYWWRVRGGNGETWGPFSEVRQFNSTTAIGQTPDLPREIALGQNYPNPFNPSTVIPFALPAAGYVQLEIYNMLGAIVATPVSAAFDAGEHTVRFNASGLSSGTYFCRMTVNGAVFIRPMLLLK